MAKDFVSILKDIGFESNHEAGSEGRALEILACMDPIFSAIKPWWAKRIKELFEEYTGGADLAMLLERRKDGLYFDFHKVLLIGMCNAWEK